MAMTLRDEQLRAMAMALVGAVVLDATEEEKDVLASDVLRMIPKLSQFRQIADHGQLVCSFRKGKPTHWGFNYVELEPPDAA